ncbi:hypothetical protein [Crateriforma conspicua]|uniref:hypothetical protein n=1 Tax=Crateriforma conspicua TaxID=2527996 RepID=UPI0011A94BE3|nr:hypothetical protein [Crateriforma conspicua]
MDRISMDLRAIMCPVNLFSFSLLAAIALSVGCSYSTPGNEHIGGGDESILPDPSVPVVDVGILVRGEARLILVEIDLAPGEFVPDNAVIKTSCECVRGQIINYLVGDDVICTGALMTISTDAEMGPPRDFRVECFLDVAGGEYSRRSWSLAYREVSRVAL